MEVQLVAIWVTIFIVFTAPACKHNTTETTNSLMFDIQSGEIELEIRINAVNGTVVRVKS